MNGYINIDDRYFDVYYKSKSAGFVGVGVGYNVKDNARIDLTYDHFFNLTLKQGIKKALTKIPHPFFAVANASTHSKTRFQIDKLKIDTLLFNAYLDLFDLNVVKIFAGAGAGMSLCSAKMIKSYTTSIHTPTGEKILSQKFSTTTRTKTNTNFAYALYLGVSNEFNYGVHTELTYSFRDIGKLKGVTKRFNGHQVAVGVRFEL